MGRQKYLTAIIVAVAVLSAMLHDSVQAAQYRVHELGTLPGDGQSVATRINNLGQVLGYSHSHHGDDTTGVFLWAGSTGMIDIQVEGRLDRPGGINDSGLIAGTGLSLAGAYATIRETDGTLRKLPQPEGVIGSCGMDINNAGQVVGWSHDGTCYSAVLWDSSGGVVTLGGGDELWSRANDINNVGQVVWTRDMPDFFYSEQAYRWDQVNGSIPLVLLDGTSDNVASSLNDSGWIVGASGNHAVLWTTPGDVVDLGASGWACGINNHGQIVGELGGRAVLWNADGSIAAVLHAILGGSEGSGAYAINDHGWIAGYRLDSYGNQQAVLWEPVPEPSSLLALAGGLAGLGGMA
ncbi:MAG: hypothetical protein NTU88_06105, partial [Armatimonadetes bacterium]|nr:hypothetical protein [Armatimonadota bacterium]